MLYLKKRRDCFAGLRIYENSYEKAKEPTIMNFQKALPIWLKGKECEMNVQARFTADFAGADGMNLKLTGASFYKVLLNGKLIHYGPAPTARGYARVDVIALDCAEGSNHLEIEAAGYYCYNFECVRQPSFLQAEVVCGDEVIAATGYDFAAYRVNSRLQKTVRYSFQRQFSESWDLHRADMAEEIAVLDLGLTYLDRKAPMPDMEPESMSGAICKDTFTWKENDWTLPSLQGAIDGTGELISGFLLEQIEENQWRTLSGLSYSIREKPAAFPMELSGGEFAVFKNAKNTAALMHVAYTASDDAKILLAYDEKLVNDRFDCEKWDNVNVISVKASGDVDFTSFVIGGFQYWGLFVLEGSITLKEAGIVKCRNSADDLPALKCDDPVVQGIYQAAFESFKCNSLGVYMDCPSRERAGWLCDSYFTSQAEYAFTGDTKVEDDFCENFLLCRDENIPEGMLPMCYPSDHTNKNFIPQWAMWFILELDQYKDRNKNADMAPYCELARRLIGYLDQFENEFGLLEKLPMWNFVEWSEANDWTADINFPTNMLYAQVLEAISGWTGDESMAARAKKIREKVREMSYDGQFFRDHAVRNEENVPVLCEHISEVCQHYAFRFGVADSESYPELYQTLLTDFKPSVQKWGFPKLNSLMGMYMRMELLYNWGLYDMLMEEIKDFFGHMADFTGTLWEHKHMYASLNHGFASFVGALILKIYNKELNFHKGVFVKGGYSL